MEFNSGLKIKNGVNFEEFAESLQKFTDMYLYIDEDLKLYSVKTFGELPYGQCKLIEVNNGFLLQENKTGRLLKVFLKEFMKYLTEDEYDEHCEKYDEHCEKYDEHCEKYDEHCEKYDEQDRKYESENDDVEFLGFEDSDIKELVNHKNISEIVSHNSERDLTKISSKVSSQERESTKVSSKVSSQGKHNKTVFRIFLRDSDDINCINSICVNKALFSDLENYNEIDLKETITLSFKGYLENKGYKVKIDVDFNENIFGELLIKSDEKISQKVLNDIEITAMLELKDNETIFFILKSANIIDNMIDYREDIYTYEVPLKNLPEELVIQCIGKSKNIPEGESISFYYKNNEILIKNEGNFLYSVFDIDLYFYLPRLHPDVYNLVTNEFAYNVHNSDYEQISYNELPVAQFSLF